MSDALSVRAATHALLRDLGMTTIFGNPGSTELRFFDDLPADFRYVLALQESSASPWPTASRRRPARPRSPGRGAAGGR